MDYAEKYLENSRRIRENEKRILEKFKECEKYVNEQLKQFYFDAEIVWTRHEEDIKQNRFYVWLGHKGHKFIYFKAVGIEDIELLEYV